MDFDFTTDTIQPASSILVTGGLGAIDVPSGATADRPASPSSGCLRFSTTNTVLEYYNGTSWVSIVSTTSTGAVLLRANGTIPATTSTAVIPIGNTAPTTAQGTQIWSQVFTPVSTTSKIVIQFQVSIDTSTNGITGICAIFRGTTCIGVLSAPRGGSVTAYVVDQPASTATVTYSARIGPTGSGTAYVNQLSGGTFGGAMASTYSIEETV